METYFLIANRDYDTGEIGWVKSGDRFGEYDIPIAVVCPAASSPVIWRLTEFADGKWPDAEDFPLPHEILLAISNFIRTYVDDATLDKNGWDYMVERLKPPPPPARPERPVVPPPPPPIFVNGKLYYRAYSPQMRRDTGLIGEQVLVISDAEWQKAEQAGGDLSHWGHGQMLGGVMGAAMEWMKEHGVPHRETSHTVRRDRYFFDTEQLPDGDRWLETAVGQDEIILPPKGAEQLIFHVQVWGLRTPMVNKIWKGNPI